MKAVITVLGKDTVGILAKTAGFCAEHNVNVVEITQNILQGTFAMIMIVELEACPLSLPEFSKNLAEELKPLGVQIQVTRQELFDAMHRI